MLLPSKGDGSGIPFQRVMAPDLICHWAEWIATDLSLSTMPRIYVGKGRVVGVGRNRGMGMHIDNPSLVPQFGPAAGTTPVILLAGKYSADELFQTLAHELRHHWQFSLGKCTFRAGVYMWKTAEGYDTGIIAKTSYWERPWEKDASAYEEDAYRRIYRPKEKPWQD